MRHEIHNAKKNETQNLGTVPKIAGSLCSRLSGRMFHNGILEKNWVFVLALHFSALFDADSQFIKDIA